MFKLKGVIWLICNALLIEKGCDASILIDGNNTEKDAPSNGSVKGFEIVDEAKDALEKICSGIVSCADIIAIAARVSVFLVCFRFMIN